MQVITNHKKDFNMQIQNKMLIPFVALEAILYLSFLLLDIFKRASAISNVLKYTSIWLCLLFVLATFLKTKNKSIVLMLAILIFTVIADTFLLLSSRFDLGVLSFIIVQILYSFKIKALNQDSCKKYLLEALGVAFIWNIIIIFLKNEKLLTPIVVIASIYFIIFSANMLRVWIGIIKNRGKIKFKNNISHLTICESNQRLNGRNYEISFAIGLSLFYLCDIHVGLYNLSLLEIQVPKVIEMLMVNASVLIWFFYLPSQVILSIHGVTNRVEY